MENHSDLAVAQFSRGFACSQSVLIAFASDFGLSDEMALKIAAPFGGGMARTGKTCGAVTGGLLALGLKYGYTVPEGKDATYAIAQEFMHRFEHLHGSLICRDLIGFDISTPQDREMARLSGVLQKLCPCLVADAVKILQGIMAEKP
jgi:C_GCAxxG_C_C family probable redox protein